MFFSLLVWKDFSNDYIGQTENSFKKDNQRTLKMLVTLLFENLLAMLPLPISVNCQNLSLFLIILFSQSSDAIFLNRSNVVRIIYLLSKKIKNWKHWRLKWAISKIFNIRYESVISKQDMLHFNWDILTESCSSFQYKWSQLNITLKSLIVIQDIVLAVFYCKFISLLTWNNQSNWKKRMTK